MKNKSMKLIHGYNPDLPDQRDFMYSAPANVVATLPASVDLRPNCPPVYNQGQLGSCTGNSIAGAIHFEEIKQKKVSPLTPSRLFIYYNERVIEHTVKSDSGAQIRDGIKSVAKLGVCSENLWKYVISKFTQKPPVSCYKQASQNLITSYHRVPQDINQMKGCLAEGYPFVFGFTCYESFESSQVASTGVLPMPQPNEKVVGGHAVLCVGYDDVKKVFIVRNSWGVDWGMAGYFTIPYEYLTNSNLADDFWTIRTIE